MWTSRHHWRTSALNGRDERSCRIGRPPRNAPLRGDHSDGWWRGDGGAGAANDAVK